MGKPPPQQIAWRTKAQQTESLYATMLERIQIHNYRSCLDCSFELQPDLSVLIGPNGSGKTNILQGIMLTNALTRGDDAWRSQRNADATSECRVKATFRHEARKCILTSDLTVYTDEHNADQVVGSRQSWYAKDFTQSAKRVRFPLPMVRVARSQHLTDKMLWQLRQLDVDAVDLHIPEALFKALSAIYHYLDKMTYFSASQFTNPSRCPVAFELEQREGKRRGVRLREHGKFLYDLYTCRESDAYSDFISVVGPNGIGLIDGIDFSEISTSAIDYAVRTGGRVRQEKRETILVVPQFTIGSNKLSPNQLSEGTFKTVALLFYLLTRESSALLIEEPEVCVHHGLLTSIVEIIKDCSKHKQIIVSTHSDFVLDLLEPRHIYRVRRDSQMGTDVLQLTKAMDADELSALRHYLETEGNLGEYWRHGGLD